MTTEPTATPPSRFEELFGKVSSAWCATTPYSQLRNHLPSDRFVEANGVQVYVEQAGEGEPVVLLHGFCCSSFSWREVMPDLARRHRVIAPDLPGFGYTERPSSPQAYRFAGLGRTVTALLDRLEVPSAHVVGHSMGGALALWVAERHPERVRSLTLVATATPDGLVERRHSWARFRSLNYLLLHTALLSKSAVRKSLEESYYDPSLVTDELVDAYRERLLVEGVEEAYYGFLGPIEDPPPPVDLQGLEMPILVLWGGNDQIIPSSRAVPYVRRMPGARLVILDRCGHVPMEERPQEFLREVLPFLRAHRRPWQERWAAAAHRAWRGLVSRMPRHAPAGTSPGPLITPPEPEVEA